MCIESIQCDCEDVFTDSQNTPKEQRPVHRGNWPADFFCGGVKTSLVTQALMQLSCEHTHWLPGNPFVFRNKSEFHAAAAFRVNEP